MAVEVTDGQARVVDRGEFKRASLGLAFVFGVLCTISERFAPIAVRELPGPSALMFGIALALGSTMAWAGDRRGIRGALIETTGLGLLGLHGLFYILWTIAYVGQRSIVTMIFLGGMLAVPSISRATYLWAQTHPDGRLARAIASARTSRVRHLIRTISEGMGGRRRRGRRREPIQRDQ